MIIHRSKIIKKFRQWIKKWAKGSALIVHGPTGTGKTDALKTIAKEMNCQLIEAAEIKKESVASLIESSRQKSIFSTSRIIVIDNVESLSNGILELAKNAECPVIIITSNAYERSFYPLRKICKIVKFDKIDSAAIAGLLEKICRNEKFSSEPKALQQIARMSGGDVRAALMDMETLKPDISYERLKSAGYREHKSDIFTSLRNIFSSGSIESMQNAIGGCEKSAEELLLWTEENIANHYAGMEDVAHAFECLARADFLSSRGMKKYADTAFYGLISIKNHVAFERYSMPKKMYAAAFTEEEDEMARQLHVSKKDARRMMPLARILSRQSRL